MSKRNNCKYKISRRLGASLWGRAKDPYNTRNYPPGMHGSTGYKKQTEYGIQLQAKQKLKKYYGEIREKQFVRTYKEAVRRKGDTGENLVGLLESRLDAVVYRAMFAPTIFAARQLVSHGHMLVNGKKVNIASYQVKAGDIIEVKEKSKQMVIILEAMQSNERAVPDYFQRDDAKLTAQYTRVPALEDIPYPTTMEPNLVIEFYSR